MVNVQNRLSLRFRAFVDQSKDRFTDALLYSHAECIDGMNRGDVGANHRLSCVKRVPGLLTDDGVVTAQPFSEERPKNTTYFKIDTPEGPAMATVNCVHRRGDRLYQLTKREAYSLANFPPMGRLLDVDGADSLVEHLMIGITHSKPRKDGSVSFCVRMLGGTIDFDSRFFRTDYEELIVEFDTRNKGPRVVDTRLPEGPQPPLKPKRPSDNS